MKEEKIPAEAVQEKASPGIDPGLLGRIQDNFTQLINLQKEQQQNMRQLIAMQQQLLSTLLESGAPVEHPLRQPAAPSSLEAVPPPAALPPLAVSPNAPAFSMTGAAGEVPASTPPPNGPVASHATPATLPVPAESTTGAGAEPASLPSTEEFQSVLLYTVSERTGYPENMLDLDAHMEADLGIDSIKLVEILSTLEDYRERLNVGEIEESFEELGGLKTLRSIVEWYDKNRARALEERADKKKT